MDEPSTPDAEHGTEDRWSSLPELERLIERRDEEAWASSWGDRRRRREAESARADPSGVPMLGLALGLDGIALVLAIALSVLAMLLLAIRRLSRALSGASR
jgi:hypothetical protein